jgi:hypothetical protein
MSEAVVEDSLLGRLRRIKEGPKDRKWSPSSDAINAYNNSQELAEILEEILLRVIQLETPNSGRIN